MDNHRWEDLYGYWQSKNADGRPPARRDIDPPTEIPQLVSNLMLIDVTPAGYQYRLVGSTLRKRTGTELTASLSAPAAKAKASAIKPLFDPAFSR
jgi:hypothetical protein